MKNKEKNAAGGAKRPLITIIMYIAASTVALIAIASLVNNIMLYQSTVAQYVAQGYPKAVVNKQLIPSQLLPGIFDAIGIYGGIAFVIFCAGIIHKKVSKCLTLLTKDEIPHDTAEDSVLPDNNMDKGNTEAMPQSDNSEEIGEAADDTRLSTE